MTYDEIRLSLLVERQPDSIKSDFGRTCLIGGSLNYPGAMIIASDFAYLSGNGYTAVSVPETIRTVIQSRVNPTEIFEILKTKNDDFDSSQDLSGLNRYDAVLFGNGVSVSEENRRFLENLIRTYGHNLVIDASGLTLLARNPEILLAKNPGSHIVLTPHLKEASALFQQELTSRNAEEMLPYASEFAKTYGVDILLKSYRSMLVSDEGYYHSSDEPCPLLARAGSGDALAGLLAGFLAYSTKTLSFEESILFVDKLYHEAALMAAQEDGVGPTSVLNLERILPRLIREGR